MFSSVPDRRSTAGSWSRLYAMAGHRLAATRRRAEPRIAARKKNGYRVAVFLIDPKTG
jgi:hypothetical protein